MKHSTLISLLMSASSISGALLPLTRRHETNPKIITSTQNGVTLRVEVQVGDQTFYLVPDTGSSDLWVPTTDFQCVEPGTNLLVKQEECHFGNTYEIPESTQYVTNQTFGVQYGTGIALGKVGLANVTINGIRVENQKIGLVDRTNDVGDGLGSGILGLGFPPLTSAHPGTELDNSTLLINRAVYDPVFVSMYKQDLVETWYSFAIERPHANATQSPGGWLGLGELPPVSHSNNWAVKPIEVTKGLPEELTGGKREITLMTLTVDGVTWGHSPDSTKLSDSTPFQAVVDTGNHMNLFPNRISKSINEHFDPPGILDKDLNVYIVDCNATTPEVGVTLDGQTFWHKSPDDLIYHDVSGFCYSSVAPTGENGDLALNFIGDAFLRNVVSVYDMGKEEMRFAARTPSDDQGDRSGNDQSGHQPSSPATPTYISRMAISLPCLIMVAVVFL